MQRGSAARLKVRFTPHRIQIGQSYLADKAFSLVMRQESRQEGWRDSHPPFRHQRLNASTEDS
jgi:hypothetical protein